MQGEDIHINLWLTKQKIIIGLVVCFRLFDVMVPGVFFFFVGLRIWTITVVFFGFKCLPYG